MERKIEFKGLREDNGEWIYGNLIVRKSDGYLRYYIYNNSIDETEISEYCDSSDCMNPFDLEDLFIRVRSNSMGQYTGLTDQTNVELYEGDIVAYKTERFEVVFEDGMFQQKDENGDISIWFEWYLLIKVGNKCDKEGKEK